MNALQLTPADRKEKRGQAHHLDPVVAIGVDGLSDTVVNEIDAALTAHGLIKVRMYSDSRDDREAALALLSTRLQAAAVQHIGKLLVLWRPIPDKASEARDDRMPGPRIVKIVKFSKRNNHRPQVKKVKVFGNQRVTAGGSIKRVKARTLSVKKKAQSN